MTISTCPAVADPVVTLTPDVDPLEGNATDNITLTCSWNSTVFYLVWFKDGSPLYRRDLVSGDTVDNTSASVAVEVEGRNSTLTFSQVSDSGSYTCAVTCRSKDSAEEDIPVQFRATKEVLIYGGLALSKLCNIKFCRPPPLVQAFLFAVKHMVLFFFIRCNSFLVYIFKVFAV